MSFEHGWISLRQVLAAQPDGRMDSGRLRSTQSVYPFRRDYIYDEPSKTTEKRSHMLYKFKSQATADVILLEADALQILRIIGKEPGAQGIVTVAQIPSAVTALQAAISADEAAPSSGAQHYGNHHVNHDEAANGAGVSLRQHAVPFIDMLRRSAEDGKDVVWGV